MGMIKRKLQSEKGASITFALLIFLVCAVASSIVIVAATTTSGRLSGLATSDQRYYAVTSAAKLLCDEFGKKELHIEGTQEDPYTNLTVTYLNPAESGSHPILEDASKKLVYAYSSEFSIDPVELSLTTNKSPDNLACEIKETLLDSGLLQFEISSTGGDPKGRTYTLTVTFASNYKETAAYSGEVAADVSWKLQSLQKYNAAFDTD